MYSGLEFKAEIFIPIQKLALMAMTCHDKLSLKHSSVSFSHKCESNSVWNFLQKQDQNTMIKSPHLQHLKSNMNLRSDYDDFDDDDDDNL